MSAQHDGFLSRLDGSQPAVDAVAAWLRRRGHKVDVPELRKAPTAAEAADYSDRGDIWLMQRVEVKGLSILFTSAADWPFREVFVSSKDDVEKNGSAVLAYVSVSADLRYAAIIGRATRPSWYVTPEKLNRNTGNRERFYACPVPLVVFKRMEGGP